MTVVAADEIEATAAPAPAGADAPAPVSARARAIALLKTRAGRLALVAVFIALMAGLQMDRWWVIGICLALTSALPRHRKAILIPAAAAFAFLMPPVDFAVLGELGAARGVTTGMMSLWWIAVPIVWAMAFAYLGVIH